MKIELNLGNWVYWFLGASIVFSTVVWGLYLFIESKL
jgi:hypothetical protein